MSPCVGPCPHSGLKTSLDCSTNTALVSWTPGSGILFYNASASAFATAHVQSCSTSNSSCNISNLQCAESYRVTVSGEGQNCPSPTNDWNRISAGWRSVLSDPNLTRLRSNVLIKRCICVDLLPTAPCAPTQLSVGSSCDSNNISVSWQASQGSVSYTAVAENAAGLRWSCNTSSTSCQITALPCGQQYHVYAAGFDEKCIGARSNVEVIRTGRPKACFHVVMRRQDDLSDSLPLLSAAPCVPQSIQTSLDCLHGVLNVTWQSTGYVVQFHASVVSSTGDVSSCKTDEHHCSVDHMQCGHTYSIKVLAEDDACNSSYSPTQHITAGLFSADVLYQIPDSLSHAFA